jgi:uncharacterized protein YbjT (DUF2867 family)
MQSQTAVVIGASGLTGSYVLNHLLDDPYFTSVHILVRRPLNMQHPKLKESIVDFNDLTDFKQHLSPADCLFCCIGTTTKKVKGDKEAYRKVDYDIPVNAAKIAVSKGFSKYLLVSAIGADARASNFYLKLKGEVEDVISLMAFRSIHIFQPSILLGKRNEFRLGEMIGKGIIKALSFFLIGSLSKFKPVNAEDVARAMIAAAKSSVEGTRTYRYNEMMNTI